MAADKRRLVGPGGAVFVPNVDEDTIQLRLASGEWSELPKPKAEPKPERSERAFAPRKSQDK